MRRGLKAGGACAVMGVAAVHAKPRPLCRDLTRCVFAVAATAASALLLRERKSLKRFLGWFSTSRSLPWSCADKSSDHLAITGPKMTRARVPEFLYARKGAIGEKQKRNLGSHKTCHHPNRRLESRSQKSQCSAKIVKNRKNLRPDEI